MAYQRLLNLRIIMTFALAALLVVAVSCGGAAEPTSEPGAPAPTQAPTQAPAAQAPSQPATPAPATATRAAPTGATPVPRAQATATPTSMTTAMAKPEGTLNIAYKDLYNFGTHPRSLAGNPDSPQAGVFLTSIIDEIVGVATYYIHYHAI